MENDLQVKYDSICYITFANIRTLTKEAKRICLKGFDWKNKEHKFVVHVINACSGILGNKEVAMDVGPLTRNTIARECIALGRIRKILPSETIFVNVPELLDMMREYACELCGAEFNFGIIYDEYYSGKETNEV